MLAIHTDMGRAVVLLHSVYILTGLVLNILFWGQWNQILQK